MISICFLSGIPGKKCGTIILSAEELGNCRVSLNSLIPISLPTKWVLIIHVLQCSLIEVEVGPFTTAH